MKTISTVGVVQRGAEEVEVEVHGSYVRGSPGSREDPPEHPDVEDIVARRIDNLTVEVELTVDEESYFRASLLENYEVDSYEPEDWD